MASLRIDVGTPSHSASLRDYFLGLGAIATLGDGATVDVSFPEGAVNSGQSIEEYLRSWVQSNNVTATIVPLLRPPGAAPPAAPAPAAKEEPPRRLGDLLVMKGFITAEQLAYAIVEARKEGELLGRLLLRHEWIFESELARVLAEQWGLPYLNLQSVGVDRQLVQLLPAEVGARVAAIPVRQMNDAIQVAFADPSDPIALAAVREHIPSVVPAVAELSDIKSAWRTAAPAVAARVDEEAPPPPTATGRPKIGELFLQAGLITQENLDTALKQQQVSGKPLGEILVTSGLIDRLDLASALSKQWSAGRPAEPADQTPTLASTNGHVAGLPQEPIQVAEPPQERVQTAEPPQEPVRVAEAPQVEAAPIELPSATVAELAQAVRQLTAAVERLHGQVGAADSRDGVGQDDEPAVVAG